MQFRVLSGTITTWKAEAIVHSASSTLLDVTLQDHALYSAAGISLAAACRALKSCPVGEAVVTKGYKLPAAYVIHAVGPYWVGGKRGEEQALISAYTRALQAAREKGIRHVAFTSLCTEDKRYPRSLAAAAAVSVLLEKGRDIPRIDMVCDDEDMQNIYAKAAIYWWLCRISEAAADQQESLLDEAAAALVLLKMTNLMPDPLVMAETVQYVRDILEAFLKKGKKRTIVDQEQTVAAVLNACSDGNTTPATALRAVVNAYRNSLKEEEKGDTLYE